MYVTLYYITLHYIIITYIVPIIQNKQPQCFFLRLMRSNARSRPYPVSNGNIAVRKLVLFSLSHTLWKNVHVRTRQLQFSLRKRVNVSVRRFSFLFCHEPSKPLLAVENWQHEAFLELRSMKIMYQLNFFYPKRHYPHLKVFQSSMGPNCFTDISSFSASCTGISFAATKPSCRELVQAS